MSIDRRTLKSKKLRRCLSMHGCCLCGKTIILGEYYYDGGYNRRAHENCVAGVNTPYCNFEWESQIILDGDIKNPTRYLIATNIKTKESRRYKENWNGLTGMLNPESIQEPYDIWDEKLKAWIIKED